MFHGRTEGTEECSGRRWTLVKALEPVRHGRKQGERKQGEGGPREVIR